MQELIERVRSTVGVPDADRCYCLKLPGPLGGTYAVDNIGLIGRAELISFSGDIARQIDDLPDGAQITLKTPINIYALGRRTETIAACKRRVRPAQRFLHLTVPST